MNRRIAKAIIKVCDFMNGYIGQEITQALIDALLAAPLMLLMMIGMVLLSR